MNAHLLLLSALLASMAYECSAAETISTGTALAIGVAAVIGLKLAAVAGFAVARAVGGGGGRRRGGRRGGRRGRRDLVVDVAVEEEQEEDYFRLVERVDSLGCGLRVVCELEARDQSQLQADERLILSLFGSKPLPPSYSQLTRSAVGKYQLAAFVGAEKKNAQQCAQMFGKCPFTSQELMQGLRSTNSSQ